MPVEQSVKTKLDSVVDKFVNELVSADANSPEFGKKVDELTNMGRKQIADAAGHSNRFLDRPIRAIDKDSGIFKPTEAQDRMAATMLDELFRWTAPLATLRA